ncbi:ABC transporter [Marasmius fiardii PR-910]|nr:ABC transporter [Marasmius fiardii PR-910]
MPKITNILPHSSKTPPPKGPLDEADIIPEVKANILSLILFQWLTPLLRLGYSRPLEATDLYKLQDERSAAYIGNRILESWERRQKTAEEYNNRLANGKILPGWRKVWWTAHGRREEREKHWREVSGKKKPSLAMAMNDSVAWWFWSSALLKILGDTAQLTSPLLVKAIVSFATDSYNGHLTGGPVPSIGKGLGMALGLLGLNVFSSLCMNHFVYRSTSTGVLIRAGLINAIYQQSMRLTTRSRSRLTNGLIMNHISTDVSRIDFACGNFHASWTAPIQMIICLVQLLLNLGPSALAGFSFFIMVAPLQTWLMKYLFKFRAKSMQWTDKRANLIQELLNGMKVVKYFAWEVPFLDRITDYRKNEVYYLRTLLVSRAGMNALAMALPSLAAVLAFITYSLSGHTLDPANVFASLTLFNLLRVPLMLLPLSLSSIVDASNATKRLYDIFEAETVDETRSIDESVDYAIQVHEGTFTWDPPPPEAPDKRKPKKCEPAPTEKLLGDSKPFTLPSISVTIPRGQLVAIVGQVGSGKSSLLQALIGEMRQTNKTPDTSVRFGGTVSYSPQMPWIQNATIRDNVTFGRRFDEVNYREALRKSCLERDLAMLPHGDMTEVGEKGIGLSGGQKQRISIARGVYSDADVQIFDDPLSALDAHVGKAVFRNVFHDPTSSSPKTRILVTHALHFLPEVDYIYVLEEGRIVERGTYEQLMNDGKEFSKFVGEFGSGGAESEDTDEEEQKVIVPVQEKQEEVRKPAAIPTTLMQGEERNSGAIDPAVYKAYFQAANGQWIFPILVVSVCMVQGVTIMSSYWLVYWQENRLHMTQGAYMGIYGVLGFSQAVAIFIMGSAFALMTYFASQKLHRAAILRVMNAPLSFFETTPLGRIMNRFSKDIDTVDNNLTDSFRMLTATISNILGAVILISILLPYFLIAVFVILLIYIYIAHFYRASSQDFKRLDSILRSELYAHFSESLSGLVTVRAYGESSRFMKENEKRIDLENRAYWLTVVNQRWLGVRLDFLGALMTFSVALLIVGTRFTISPAQTGVVLSYILNIQQAFSWLVRQYAIVEANMNSVERVVYYADNIEQEAAHGLPCDKELGAWPKEGRVEFKDVVMSYRPGLPPVLKGVSLSITPGEKVGIVGRTGAGKSSLMTALYRIVEVSTGTIDIDGRDISQVGLTELRKAFSYIPQEPLLFSGTLRTNLDPFNLHDDATLYDALKRSYLVESESRKGKDEDISTIVTDDASTLADGVTTIMARGVQDTSTIKSTHTPTGSTKFTLDTVIEDEGGNLSMGQRSLVSLARALVKNTKVLILDEATASVDYETDRKIQDTIAREFKDSTILCIAHRLRTIISYDRICVLDAGQIVEFDTPSNLFGQAGIFRSMCEKSGISLEDIRMARNERQVVEH